MRNSSLKVEIGQPSSLVANRIDSEDTSLVMHNQNDLSPEDMVFSPSNIDSRDVEMEIEQDEEESGKKIFLRNHSAYVKREEHKNLIKAR